MRSERKINMRTAWADQTPRRLQQCHASINQTRDVWQRYINHTTVLCQTEEEELSGVFHCTLAAFIPTASFIWKSGNKLAGIQLREENGGDRKHEERGWRVHLDIRWPLYKSLCSDRRKQQYSGLCWVTLSCRTNLTLLSHTKRRLHWVTTHMKDTQIRGHVTDPWHQPLTLNFQMHK